MTVNKLPAIAFTILVLLNFMHMEAQSSHAEVQMSTVNDSVLRHVVLFKFKVGTSEEKITEIENAFGSLQDKIPEITSYEWGLNNSPEGLEKGFTHCFLVSFGSEEDRGVYLPHPDHQAFVGLLKPHLEDVLVVDYWAKKK